MEGGAGSGNFASMIEFEELSFKIENIFVVTLENGL